MDFVPIGHRGNVGDTTGAPNPAGSVPCGYRMGTCEVSRDMITKASAPVASGGGNLEITMEDMSSYGGKEGTCGSGWRVPMTAGTAIRRRRGGCAAAIGAMQRAAEFTRRFPFALKCDLRQCFASIDHGTLRRALARVIADEGALWLTDLILASHVERVELRWPKGAELFDFRVASPLDAPGGRETAGPPRP